jgi:hypothetical protein
MHPVRWGFCPGMVIDLECRKTSRVRTARHHLRVERKSPLLPLHPDTLGDAAALTSRMPHLANFTGDLIR